MNEGLDDLYFLNTKIKSMISQVHYQKMNQFRTHMGFYGHTNQLIAKTSIIVIKDINDYIIVYNQNKLSIKVNIRHKHDLGLKLSIYIPINDVLISF